MFRESIHKSNFYQCEETNCLTICQTETRHQQIRKNADKIWIFSRGYQWCRENTPPDVSIQQTPKTSTSTKMSQNQPYSKKTSPSYTQQCQHQNKFKKFQNKYCCIPQTELKIHKRESVPSASSSKPKGIFQFYKR